MAALWMTWGSTALPRRWHLGQRVSALSLKNGQLRDYDVADVRTGSQQPLSGKVTPLWGSTAPLSPLGSPLTNYQGRGRGGSGNSVQPSPT
ncbi:unnamed protein product [Gadus morhua 'NCC']